MRRTKILFTLLSLFVLQSLPLCAQELQRFSVSEFRQDPMDLSARNDQYKRTDDNGALYSIIKVKSNLPDDDLQSYRFDFGLMNSFVVHHPEKEELWVYVQKNAKTVSIKRDGYVDVDKYDLRTTIDAGNTYVMRLSVTADVVFTQMVQFIVQPVGVRAAITVKGIQENAVEELFGQTDETGSVVKNLPFGTYTYRVVAEDYLPSEGRLTLNDRTETLTENIALKPNGLPVTLRVAADADIYVDNQRKGKREWTGILKTGTHQVECRQQNYRSSKQYISVKEEGEQSFALIAPTPITGTIAVTSKPLGATISIDGKEVGKSPKNLNDILIGSHNVTLSQRGYEETSKTVQVLENQTTEVAFDLRKLNAAEMAALGQVDGNDTSVQLSYQKPTCGYVLPTFQVGSLMAAGITAGAYIHQFNIEATFLYGLGKSEDIWWTVYGPFNYQPMLIGGKVGYGINVAKNRLRLTPQFGVHVVSISDTSDDGESSKGNALSAAIGVRADYAFSSFIGIYFAPEIDFAVKRSEVFGQLADATSKIKGWGTGFNVRLGLRFSF